MHLYLSSTVSVVLYLAYDKYCMWRGTEHKINFTAALLGCFHVIVCMVIGFGDIVYSFYIASHGKSMDMQFDEFQHGQATAPVNVLRITLIFCNESNHN